MQMCRTFPAYVEDLCSSNDFSGWQATYLTGHIYQEEEEEEGTVDVLASSDRLSARLLDLSRRLPLSHLHLHPLLGQLHPGRFPDLPNEMRAAYTDGGGKESDRWNTVDPLPLHGRTEGDWRRFTEARRGPTQTELAMQQMRRWMEARGEDREKGRERAQEAQELAR